MAKVVGLVGSASGKIGNIVYAVTNGVQVARVYQPQISNPKSEGQKFQRAKANLVGQVSKITPWQVLVGLGNNKRERRSRFLRLLLNKTTAGYAAGSTTGINAKLLSEDFVFSEGTITPNFNITNLSATAYTISGKVVTLGGAAPEDIQSSGALVVIVLLDSNGNYEHVFYKFVKGTDVGAGFDFEFLHIYEGGYSVVAYLAPFSTIDGSSLRAVANQLYGDGFDFAATMEYNPSALPLRWGNSVKIATATYTPA